MHPLSWKVVMLHQRDQPPSEGDQSRLHGSGLSGIRSFGGICPHLAVDGCIRVSQGQDKIRTTLTGCLTARRGGPTESTTIWHIDHEVDGEILAGNLNVYQCRSPGVPDDGYTGCHIEPAARGQWAFHGQGEPSKHRAGVIEVSSSHQLMHRPFRQRQSI